MISSVIFKIWGHTVEESLSHDAVPEGNDPFVASGMRVRISHKRILNSVIHGIVQDRATPPFERMTQLLELGVMFAGNPEILDGRNTGYLMHGLGKVAERNPYISERARTDERFDVVCKVLRDRLSENVLDGRALSMTSWGLARLGCHDLDLLDALADRIITRTADMDARDLSNVAWAFSAMQLRNGSLLSAISSELRRVPSGDSRGLTKAKIRDLEGQGICNTACAFIKLEACGEEALLNDLAQEMLSKMRKAPLHPRDIANATWAFSRSGIRNTELYSTVADEMVRRKSEFRVASDICDCADAFAQAGVRDEVLFEALADAGTRLIEGFNAQHICSIAKSFALLNIENDQFFGTLAEAAVKKKHNLTVSDIAKLSWAFATLNVDNRPFMLFLMSEVCFKRGPFPMRDVAKLSWAFSSMFARTTHEAELINLLRAVQRVIRPGVPDAGDLLQMHQALAAAGLRKEDEYPPALSVYMTEERQKRDEDEFQREVRETLESLGCSVKPGFLCGGVEADFMVTVKGGRRIVQCDYPESHRVGGKTGGRYTGAIVLQDKIFTRNGYPVLHIPRDRWDKSSDKRATLAKGLGIAVF